MDSLFHSVGYKNHSVGYVFHTVKYKNQTVGQRICGRILKNILGSFEECVRGKTLSRWRLIHSVGFISMYIHDSRSWGCTIIL